MTLEDILRRVKIKTPEPEVGYGINQSLPRLMKKIDKMENSSRLVRMSKIYRRIAIAATVGLLFAIGEITFVLSSKTEPEYTEVTNVSGNVKQIRLSDGSIVDLNVGSKIIYAKEFKSDKREVFLTGEAFFNVSKDRRKPFVVRVGDISIRVLGTQFNVKAYLEESNITTTLLKGSVLIENSSTGKKQPLIPNDVYSFNQRSKAVTLINSSNLSATIAWRYGVIKMEKMSMEEVCLQLERVYNVKIIILNSNLKKKHFTGELSYNESLEDILETLIITTPFKYTVKQQTYIIK